MTAEARTRTAPWLLSAPALLLFGLLVLLPLALTAVLSLHPFNHNSGVLPGFTLANFAGVLGDSFGRCLAAPPGWRC